MSIIYDFSSEKKKGGNASNVETKETAGGMCRAQNPRKRVFTNRWAREFMGINGCC